MLISDKLVFVELQKTGSTHIKNLLTRLVGGENDGKHNVPTPEIIASGRQFIGSVRDPWSWYLSLWTYGCERKGSLYGRMTNPKHWRKTLKRMERKADQPASPEIAIQQRRLPLVVGPKRSTDYLYADPANAAAFREWLCLIHSRRLRGVVDEDYDTSPINRIGGLMTFRYFNLFVQGTATMSPEVTTIEQLMAFEHQHLLLNHVVRQKTLVEDLLKAIAECGVVLSEKQQRWAREYRSSNRSTRPHAQGYYYDQASIDLVNQGEQFIIQRFGYSAPALSPDAAP
jgi:hypothetical protein